MRICFDMDGTIANFYGVEGWLEDLMAQNPRPYEVAGTLVNMNALARMLNRLQRQGHEIVIVSWLSKRYSAEFDKAVTEAKIKWLKKHLGSVNFDEINITRYGVSKDIFCQSTEDVLFDDEEQNRLNWTGRAYGVDNILETLKTF